MSSNLADMFLLDPDVVFLNHGSYGACPKPVFEVYQNLQRELESQPVAFLAAERNLTARMREAREIMGAEVGSDPNNLVSVVNATSGLNIAIQSLDLKQGDEILTTDHEYAALEKTLAYVCNRSGARIVVAEVPLPLISAEDFENAVLEKMTDRTRVLFLSHITSPTALLFPIEKLIKIARERDIISIIDGAHTPGHTPLSLDALGADVYSGNFHKWTMSPKGSGFLYVRPDMQQKMNPLVISHGWTQDWHEPGQVGPFGNTAFVDSIEVQGTRDPAAFLATVAAIQFRKENDWDLVARNCHDLAQETAGRVREMTGLEALSTPEFCAPQMVAMPIPECAPLEIHVALRECYNIEMPVFEWNGRHIARLSCQGYNTRAQMDILVSALKELLSL